MSKLYYYCKQDNHYIINCPNYKKQSFNTWWQDDYQLNFHMYSDDKGHIVDENDNYFVNYIFLYIKIEKIKFKINYRFDLRNIILISI